MSFRKTRPEPQGDNQRGTLRRPNAPTGRAVTGGFLVTVAAVGTFAAYRGASDDRGRDYVVTTRDLPAGHRLERSDLRVEHGDLAMSLASGSFTSQDELEGTVTLAPMGPSDLIQRSQVTGIGDRVPDGASEFSFAIEREHALAGDIRRGEAIDVLATFGTGSDSYTLVVAQHATVVDTSDAGRATIGSGARLVITLALDSPDQTIALAHATQTAAITIVRTRGDASPGPLRYPDATRTAASVAER